MNVQRDGRNVTVEVSEDGEGLVSHAGSALFAQVADKTGLTRALCGGLVGTRQRRGVHDPGRVIGDPAVMLADGGDCLVDLRGATRPRCLGRSPLTPPRFGSSTRSRGTPAAWTGCA